MGIKSCLAKPKDKHKDISPILIQLKSNNISQDESLISIPIHSNDDQQSSITHKSLQKIISLLIYNTSSDIITEEDIPLKVISNLEGLGEINIDNSLYLCGSYDNKETNYAVLLHIDLKKSTEVEILINSQFPHVYPSMVFIEPKMILVVGGVKQLFCEGYDIKESRWEKMPELPEERYQCTLIVNPSKTHVYLFGGYDNASGRNVSKSILRLFIEKAYAWDKIIIKENDALLNRNSCAGLVLLQSNHIYLLGGRNDSNEALDDVIEFDTGKFMPNKLNIKLSKAASFKNQSGCNIDYTEFYFLDSKAKSHKLNLLDLTLN